MTKNPEYEDIEASISSIDTDMGLDMDFEGDFADDYKVSIESIRYMDNQPYGTEYKRPTILPEAPEDTTQ